MQGEDDLREIVEGNAASRHQGAAVEQSGVARSNQNTRNYITILCQPLRTFRMSYVLV